MPNGNEANKWWRGLDDMNIIDFSLATEIVSDRWVFAISKRGNENEFWLSLLDAVCHLNFRCHFKCYANLLAMQNAVELCEFVCWFCEYANVIESRKQGDMICAFKSTFSISNTFCIFWIVSASQDMRRMLKCVMSFEKTLTVIN